MASEEAISSLEWSNSEGRTVGRFIIKERDGFEGFFFLTMSDRKYYRKALDQRERDKKEKQAFNKKDIVR